MPERPDLEYVIPLLNAEIPGQTITDVVVKKPIVLRLAVPGQPKELFVGRTLGKVTRRAHFLVFPMTGGPELLDLVVAPMLAGKFALEAPSEKSGADVAVTWTLSGGSELRYRDDVQMGKVYVIPHDDYKVVPGLEKIGIDVLDSKKFTKAAFRALVKTRRDQVKVFMLDKSALDAMGNAYADEVLFEAGLHPKTMTRSLADDDVDRLHDAIVKVLSSARAEVARRKAPMDEKVRDFLKVRNRHGEPCPRCGTKIRKAGVHGHDAFFCPQCQQETRKSSIVDWRKIPGKE